jgi:hypothetical protein
MYKFNYGNGRGKGFENWFIYSGKAQQVDLAEYYFQIDSLQDGAKDVTELRFKFMMKEYRMGAMLQQYSEPYRDLYLTEQKER